MKEQLLKELEELKKQALSKIREADSLTKVEEIRVSVFGKKGALTQLSKHLKDLTHKEKPIVGQKINALKELLEEILDEQTGKLREEETKRDLLSRKIDVTIPGRKFTIGRRHPISIVMDEIKDIFISMGFKVADGPEIETDFYNFEALNFPDDHPSRDMQDTLFISDKILLRTHTSPVQVRTMLNNKPPIAIIVPGKVYRHDLDASHSPMFHQVEGLLVDEKVTMANLKGTLELFVHKFFGKDKKMRFRPSFFPFVEPGAEIDVQCTICGGVGCRVCKNSGWLEILGAGMVHPNVFKYCNIDPEKYTGYAFGMGVDRITMLKYGINDIRLFFDNDLRFLKQFR